MLLQNIAVLLAAGVANVQAAAVSAFQAGTHTLLHSRPVQNGTLEYWGVAAEAEKANVNWNAGWGNEPDIELPAPAAALERRCGSNGVSCSGSNLARTSICQSLVDALRNNPRGGIPSSTRVVTYRSGDFWCNIAWRDAVGNMVNGYLVDAAAKTLGTCGAGTTVSGWAVDVNLNNVCTNQCLSNASGC